MSIILPPDMVTPYEGISIVSFGYDRRTPPRANITIDVRSMGENPHWTVDGLSTEYLDRILTTYSFYLERLAAFIETSFDEFGPQTVAIGCTAGRHRSVAIAALLARDASPSRVTHLDYKKAPISTLLKSTEIPPPKM